jgi:hypothetical protein
VPIQLVAVSSELASVHTKLEATQRRYFTEAEGGQFQPPMGSARAEEGAHPPLTAPAAVLRACNRFYPPSAYASAPVSLQISLLENASLTFELEALKYEFTLAALTQDHPVSTTISTVRKGMLRAPPDSIVLRVPDLPSSPAGLVQAFEPSSLLLREGSFLGQAPGVRAKQFTTASKLSYQVGLLVGSPSPPYKVRIAVSIPGWHLLGRPP